MGYNLIIFDLDGTLIDTRQDLTTAVNEMLDYYGLKLKSIDEVTSYVGDGIRKLVERCTGNQKIDIEEALKIFNDSYSLHLCDNTKPYPGVDELLEKLKNRKKSILTNKPFRFTKTILDKLNLTHHFSFVVGGDTLNVKKPEPEGIKYILNKMNMNNKSTVMVGDGINDILTAKQAGIPSIYVSYGYSDITKLNGLNPDYIANDPLEILKHINNKKLYEMNKRSRFSISSDYR